MVTGHFLKLCRIIVEMFTKIVDCDFFHRNRSFRIYSGMAVTCKFSIGERNIKHNMHNQNRQKSKKKERSERDAEKKESIKRKASYHTNRGR